MGEHRPLSLGAATGVDGHHRCVAKSAWRSPWRRQPVASLCVVAATDKSKSGAGVRALAKACLRAAIRPLLVRLASLDRRLAALEERGSVDLD